MLFIAGFAYNMYMTEKNTIKVGNSIFDLPSGYSKEMKSNTEGIIKNKADTIGIQEYADNNIKKYVNEYNVTKEKTGERLIIKTYKVNNTQVYKSTNMNNTRFVHYWFVNNNKVYTVYTWHDNNNTDKIVSHLINHAKGI